MLETTLYLLRENNACKNRYVHLRKALGPKYGNNTPIGLDRILEINGLEDTVWALRVVREEQKEERNRLARMFACRCVRETPLADGRTVWDLLIDERSKNAIVIAERFAVGKATEEELALARAAAVDAAGAAAMAMAGARDAAMAATWAAAAARDAAGTMAKNSQKEIMGEILGRSFA